LPPAKRAQLLTRTVRSVTHRAAAGWRLLPSDRCRQAVLFEQRMGPVRFHCL